METGFHPDSVCKVINLYDINKTFGDFFFAEYPKTRREKRLESYPELFCTYAAKSSTMSSWKATILLLGAKVAAQSSKTARCSAENVIEEREQDKEISYKAVNHLP